MQLDYEFWRFWMTVANFIGTVLVAVYLFVTNRSRVNTERIDKLEAHNDQRIKSMENLVTERFSDHENRLTKIEERAIHAPTHEDLKRIYDKINQQSDRLNTLTGQAEVQHGILKMIQQYLLNEGKRQ